MKCPNCDQKMKKKKKTGYAFDTSGTVEDWELEFTYDFYKCKPCKIKYNGKDWKIPKKYRPTEKQIKAVEYINSMLGTHHPVLTKHQCWQVIHESLDAANKKAADRQYNNDEQYIELQEMYSMDYEDFC